MDGLHKKSSDRHYPIPKSLLSAVSMIQRLKLMENGRKSLDKDFVVLEQSVGFLEVGIRSAWFDSLIWITGYVVAGAIVYFMQDNYLEEVKTQIFSWQLDGSPLYWASKAASFSGLLFSTGLCVYMSRFYIGDACKKAINSVFMARGIFLVSLSLFIFVALNGIKKFALSDSGIEKTAAFFSFISRSFALNLFIFLHNYFKRALFEAGIIALLAGFASAVTPYISILIFRTLKKKEKILGLEEK